MKKIFDIDHEIAWCPGCGNFGIRNALMKVLENLNLKPEEVVIVSGIGQAGKFPHYVKCHMFNGLHGRALPVATAIKVINPELHVIVIGGDGDIYAEGGNHFLHALRRNPDITLLVHNNMVYGLTKGQASPTSERGFVASAQPYGVIEEPLNPVAFAITGGATFVARTFAGDFKEMEEVISQAITHTGFSVVDIFQPCVSFNKVNTYEWFRENTVKLPDNFPSDDQLTALEFAMKKNPYYTGIFFRIEKNTFEYEVRHGNTTPMWRVWEGWKKVKKFISTLK